LTGSPASSAPARLASPAFFVIVLATFAYFLSVGTLLPTLPRYIKGPLGGGSVAVGLSVGVLNFSALLLNLWAGRLGDRRGRRLLMVTGAAVAGTATAGLLVVKSLPGVLALRAIGGAGEAMFFVGGASAINDLAPDERRGEAVSYFSLALHAGIALGPMMGEAVLAADRFSLVWMVAAACALMAAALAGRLPDTRPVVTPGAVATQMVHPAAILPGLVVVSGGVGLAGFNAFVPLYALQLGLGGSRFVFFVFSAVMILMRTLAARLPDRLGPVGSAQVALLGTGAGLAAIAAWQTPAGLFAGTVIFALGHAMLFPSMLTLAVRRAPAHQRAAVVGTLTSFLDLGFAAGPVALGVVVGGFGYPGAFLTGAGVAIGGLVLLGRRAAGLARPVALSPGL
jgi:MFS family permease